MIGGTPYGPMDSIFWGISKSFLRQNKWFVYSLQFWCDFAELPWEVNFRVRAQFENDLLRTVLWAFCPVEPRDRVSLLCPPTDIPVLLVNGPGTPQWLSVKPAMVFVAVTVRLESLQPNIMSWLCYWTFRGRGRTDFVQRGQRSLIQQVGEYWLLCFCL